MSDENTVDKNGNQCFYVSYYDTCDHPAYGGDCEFERLNYKDNTIYICCYCVNFTSKATLKRIFDA